MAPIARQQERPLSLPEYALKASNSSRFKNDPRALQVLRFGFFGEVAATALGAAATAFGAAATALGVAVAVCPTTRAPEAQAITRTSAVNFFINSCRVSPSDATCR